jgi:hypothetical protein
MEELLPGVWHWTARHPRIGSNVHSHWVADAATLIDPMVPPGEGIAWFRSHGPPERILLSCRHHLRDSERFIEEFGCAIFAHESGLHEFEDGPDVRGYSYGDEVAPGIVAREYARICPDDAVLHLLGGNGTLLFGDGLINYGSLGFVSDRLIGDDPERVKGEMYAALAKLLDLKFDNLLFAHGEPLIGGGHDALRDFVSLRQS